MKKEKKTAEQAIKDGDFIPLDASLLKSAGIQVQVILPAADHKKLNIDGLMAERDGAKIHKLARAVAFEIWKCQRQGDIQMVVVGPDGDHVAAYKWDGLAAVRGLYRAVDAHLREPGATLHNYQW